MRPDRPNRPNRPNRRNRHGRGLRGPLAPKHVPLSATRAEQFDEFVLDAIEEIEHALEVRDEPELRRALAAVELAVEDIPPLDHIPIDGRAPADPADIPEVPLARSEPAAGDRPPRIVVYRRPIELRATGDDREDLVREVVAEKLAELLGVAIERLDPPD
jgi:predicted Zn-dependent protease with MMP-like domain